MRISELRTAALEALAAGAAALVSSLLIWPSDAGLHVPGPHLAWIAVLAIAARYGTEGLLLALPLAVGPLAAAADWLGATPALLARLDRGEDLLGILSAVMVAWVASSQQRGRRDLSVKLDSAHARIEAHQRLRDELESGLVTLRERTDRIDVALSFLRQVARRIDGGDPESAARAALELALARTGARAAVVTCLAPAGPWNLACVGKWSFESAGLPSLDDDHTMAAALACARPVRALDLQDARASDADLAAPLADVQGRAFGVLAVRGVPAGGTSPALLRDLAVVSEWLAESLRRDQISPLSDQVPAYAEVTMDTAPCGPPPALPQALAGERPWPGREEPFASAGDAIPLPEASAS